MANLCHIGGILVGYLYLVIWARLRRSGAKKSKKGGPKGNLRLVVDNENNESDDGPRYWN